MASGPQTPAAHDTYGSVPTPHELVRLDKSHEFASHDTSSHLRPSSTVGATDFGDTAGHPIESSPLSQSVQQQQETRFNEEFETPQRGTSFVDGGAESTHKAESVTSVVNPVSPARGGTLKKKSSLRKKDSVKRSDSRKSTRPGDVERSLALAEQERYEHEYRDEMRSFNFTPVPITGNPTEILSNRFQSWRKVLKDIIAYFREIQNSYENRSKSLLKVSNTINNINPPSYLLTEGGINDAAHILRDFHKQALAEGNKARDIEADVVVQLTGLRNDLSQKIKEIKSLSGDFKNSVEKEMEGTRRAVNTLQQSLGVVDSDTRAAATKGDPFLVKLGVDRQIERQLDEENYLHRAFLNLEGSGRELESIVVGEIQKAYNAYAGILKREADEAYEIVEKLRSGPIALPKDHEWAAFVEKDQHFVDPKMPIRKAEDIVYPGKDHPAATEVRAGMLERKSKYLKSYTPGWYVLSPTHLHEFKSADRIHSQPPVMSLFLPDQKLGSFSQAGSSSHKFMLKGRQTGSMHRGHSWVFRAESHDTMLAWYEDIKNLTEKSGEARNAFVRQHARSVSGGSQKPGSVSSNGDLDEDEADQVPYSANASQVSQVPKTDTLQRPQPGGRFPSDLQVNRDLQVPLSPSSESSDRDRDVVAAAGALPGSEMPHHSREYAQGQHFEEYPANTTTPLGVGATHIETPAARSFQAQRTPLASGAQAQPYTTQPPQQQDYMSAGSGYHNLPHLPHSTSREEWAEPAAAGVGGGVIGAAGVEAYRHHQQQKEPEHQGQDQDLNPGPPPRSNARPSDGQLVQERGFTSEVGPGLQEPQPHEQQYYGDPATLGQQPVPQRMNSSYGDWMGKTAAEAGGAAVGVAGAEAYHHHVEIQETELPERVQSNVENVDTVDHVHSHTGEEPLVAAGGALRSESYGSTGAMPLGPPSQTDSGSTAPTSVDHPVDNPAIKGLYIAGGPVLGGHDATAYPERAAPWQAQTQDVPNPLDALTRPNMPITTTLESIKTISDLHIPGEYPPTPAL
ncbi:MAG: hypothetical protein M1827_001658 [Pycnora praestabilis]|nr:MAG: hypothetical protein M1827_001658 [Pycnora praestabilis]